jgi:hypothetical protein
MCRPQNKVGDMEQHSSSSSTSRIQAAGLFPTSRECVFPSSHGSSDISVSSWFSNTFGSLSVVHLKCVHDCFLLPFIFSQLNLIFLILNVCLYFVFDLGEYIQLLNVGTAFQLTIFFLSDRFIVQFSLA